VTFAHVDDVLAEVAELATLFVDHGFRLFLVGGIVRDLWLDQPVDASSDIDLTTDARPGDTKAIVADWADAVWTQGERFGTIGCKRAGRAFEITTHRAEAYEPDSRKPVVAFGDDIETDLSRRDFTVNAMAMELPGADLVDPFDGAADLAARRLRTPLSPTVSFTDDPLRMLRAARFANRYGLVPDAGLLAAASELRERLQIVSAERIRDELEKLLRADDVRVGLDFLAQTGLVSEVLPGVTVDGLTVAAAIDAPWWLRLAGAIAASNPTDHELGEQLRALRCSSETDRAVTRAIAGADIIAGVGPPGPTDGQIRRWVLRIAPWESEALKLAAALGSEMVPAFRAAYERLAAVEDLRDNSVPLNGLEIAELLGIEPGREIGRAVRLLQNHRLDHGPFDAATARELLLQS